MSNFTKVSVDLYQAEFGCNVTSYMAGNFFSEIAIVKRGACDFDQKLSVAERNGFLGLIIVDLYSNRPFKGVFCKLTLTREQTNIYLRENMHVGVHSVELFNINLESSSFS